MTPTNNTLYVLLFVLFVVLGYIIGDLIGEIRSRLKARTFSKPCDHEWRSVAAPYARQCRKCGAAVFREDSRGEFPEGLREYFAYIDDLKKERML